jgi:hypothetical protein
MAGNITEKYAASVAPTVTNLHSLASSQDWTAGWSSASIANTSNNYQDYLVAGTFTTHASNRQAGQINIYIIGSLNDTPTFPAVSAGTIGTEGAITFTDTEERDAICRLLCSLTVDTTASAIYAFPQTAIAQLFGGRMPSHFAIYVAQNASTTTTAGLASSGSAIYHTPIYSQYT